jgi:putative membrane protein
VNACGVGAGAAFGGFPHAETAADRELPEWLGHSRPMNTKKYPSALCAPFVAAMLFSAALHAQETPLAPSMLPDAPAEETPPASTVSRADRAFLEDAAKSGQQVLVVSRAVAERLTNPDVKRFAEKMIATHSEAHAEVETLAARKAVRWSGEKTKAAEKWADKDADDLDEDYVEAMIDEHEKSVRLFEKAARSVDADIAAFAVKTLPVLQGHLDRAEALDDQLD